LEGWGLTRSRHQPGNHSSAALRWIFFTSPFSLILQQDDDHVLASSQWIIGYRLIFSTKGILLTGQCLWIYINHRLTGGWTGGGQALEPGLVKKMEVCKAALCRLKAHWWEEGLSASA